MSLAETKILIPPDLNSARCGAFKPNCEVTGFGGETMGTEWNVRVSSSPDQDLSSLQKEVNQNLDTVVQQMSPWETDSDLSRFQNAAPRTWVPFRKEAFEVLSRSLEIAAQTEGAYDPTFARAIDLLVFGPGQCKGYSYDSIDVRSAIENAGFLKIELDSDRRAVRQPGNLGLDLCSIAKGYAVDLVSNSIERYGIANYLVNIGGEMRGLGCKPDGKPWLIEIEQPDAGILRPMGYQTNPALPISPTRIALCGIALATSGDYRNYRIVEGNKIGHLVTAHPVSDGSTLLSATVLSRTCTDADALASALFLMGEIKGREFADRHGIAAQFLCASASGFHETTSRAMEDFA